MQLAFDVLPGLQAGEDVKILSSQEMIARKTESALTQRRRKQQSRKPAAL